MHSTKFDFVTNFKVAKPLGLTEPPSLIAPFAARVGLDAVAAINNG